MKDDAKDTQQPSQKCSPTIPLSPERKFNKAIMDMAGECVHIFLSKEFSFEVGDMEKNDPSIQKEFDQHGRMMVIDALSMAFVWKQEKVLFIAIKKDGKEIKAECRVFEVKKMPEDMQQDIAKMYQWTPPALSDASKN